jgi:hypothetical protein
LSKHLILKALIILMVIGFSWEIPEISQVIGEVGDCPTSCPDSNVGCYAHGLICTIYGDFCAHCADSTMYFRISLHELDQLAYVSLQEEALCATGCLCYHGSLQVSCEHTYDWELWCGDPSEIGATYKDGGNVYCSN